MQKSYFDARDRFIIPNYDAARPFSSFLPGIAGPLGIPLWVFYVNRGQAIASFGVENKDKPIIEFQPANKAYRATAYTGFRTFVKIQGQVYEPFSPWRREAATRRQMFIAMNELELQEDAPTPGLKTNVLYFTLPGENLAGLLRQLTLTNVSGHTLALEVLDGLPAVMPCGVNDRMLKDMSRTIEAWMEVYNLAQRAPFYRLRASAIDAADVQAIQAGHFALAFTAPGEPAQLLPALVDPTTVFGQNTALSAPDRLAQLSLDALLAQRQITCGRTPCAFFGAAATLAPSERLTIYTLVGHASSLPILQEQHGRLLSPTYVQRKRREAHALAQELTDPVATHTAAPLFDAYCRQTFLDNVLRGGWPMLLGGHVYHVYSRKHGDPERDYNAFYLAAEYYSQGNGNYRDVNQNRRDDVWFNPRALDADIRLFMSLIQADGYNPLVVQGSQFSLSADKRAAVLKQVVQPQHLEPLLSGLFTPGQLLKHVRDFQVELRVSPQDFLELALQDAQQHLQATFGEGYWVDHWTYNLDLIESFLALYPERQDELLFGDASYPFFDSPASVQPRAKKYVLADGQPRQFGAVVRDAEKEALLAARGESPNWMRAGLGRGDVYRTTLSVKLLCLALNKFVTLDPCGMGVEMEAGKPGWCDAMNGLPGLFGSSMPETFELQRLLAFLLAVCADKGDQAVSLPVEIGAFLDQVIACLHAYNQSRAPGRDFDYWDAVAEAREDYRASVRLGFEGATREFDPRELAKTLASFQDKVQAGVARALALNQGLPPTYFSYTMTEYETLPDMDESGRPYLRARRFEPSVLPLYLEGPVRALKVQADQNAARRLHEQVRSSDLFDRKLNMYKLNASLQDQPHAIGRARAFTPGWLENESVWLHMEYKYLLEVLKAGLYEEFFQDFKRVLVPFMDPETYGRSPLENSSFIVSSAHPDESLHGAGFTARLSGATAEFLNMWRILMAGKQPFFVQDGQLCLALKPVLPAWLFDAQDQVRFTFLGACEVAYHNPRRLDTFQEGLEPHKTVLHTQDGQTVELGGVVTAPYAEMVREGQVYAIDVFF